MVVLLYLAVVPKQPNFLSKLSVICDNRPSFAERSEIFAWIKAEATREANGARLASLVRGSVSLTRIFDDSQSAFSGNFSYGAHVRHLAKKMNGNDRFSFRGNGPIYQARIDCVGPFVYINKHRFGPAEANRLRRRHECVRNGDDLIPGPNATGQKREPERLGAASDTYGMARAAEGREILLEFSTNGPPAKAPLSITSEMTAVNSLRSGSCCVLKSRNGISI
jgi:hypothetical protein